MSKTAVLISGQFRTWNECLSSQVLHVYRHYPNLSFFVLLQDSIGPLENALRNISDLTVSERIDDPTLPEIPLHYGEKAPYANAAPHNRLLLQHWYQNEVWKLFNRSAHVEDYSTIIRMRPDNMFSENTPVYPTENECFTPWWGRFGNDKFRGVNDRFAVMGLIAAQSYFTVYEKIDRFIKHEGRPFHPETLLAASLDDGGVDCYQCDAIFSTWRTDGRHRQPEILFSDIKDCAREQMRAKLRL